MKGINSIHRLAVGVAAVLMVMTGGQVRAECFDLDGDSSFTVADMTLLARYLAGNAEIVVEDADIDDHIGTSSGDLYAMFRIQEKGLLDCNPTQSYGFGPTTFDTVYVPYRAGIEEGVTDVYMPFAVTMSHEAVAFYVPLLHASSGSNGTFALADVANLQEYFEPDIRAHSDPLLGDTVVVLGDEFFTSYTGTNLLFSLHYQRVAPGEGSIATEPVDREDPLRYAVLRVGGSVFDIDLYRPAVVPVDVSFPMGDCNCDGKLDISDLTCFVDFLFFGHPHCEPYLQPYGVLLLDLDCSGGSVADIADLVYLVAFLFAGGDPPCNPFMP